MHIKSFDFLRGLGIFFVLMLHTAFYFYSDIYDVDLDNPSLIITLIGFLLMFAGLFAMISGASHTISYIRKIPKINKKQRLLYMLKSGLLLMIVAYLYFYLTGPGIIHFETRSMDESLFVSFINHGAFQPLTMDRLFYIDSLVMISTNIWLLAIFFYMIEKVLSNKKTTWWVLGFAMTFLVISYVRIPLYQVYLHAMDEQQTWIWLLLNPFVAKNNPIFPFFAFALFGVWFALLLNEPFKTLRNRVLPVGIVLMIVGILGYIFTPETMLERAIDPTWYFIMVIQHGFFLLFMLFAYYMIDLKKHDQGIVTYVSRFGVAGLTAFFFESVVSALIFRFLQSFWSFELGIPGALLYGFILANAWAVGLYFWSKYQYRYGIEWLMIHVLNQKKYATKQYKMEGKVS